MNLPMILRSPRPLAMIKGVWSAMATGFTIETGYEGMDNLFSRGGMTSMLTTVWLIISAMAFGGVLEYTGLLTRLLQPLVKAANTDKSLVAATGLTSIGMNVVAGDQYMSIVLPGRMFRELYQERNIAPETLSRELEDTGTITSPLVPWNSCGAYMSATSRYRHRRLSAVLPVQLDKRGAFLHLCAAWLPD